MPKDEPVTILLVEDDPAHAEIVRRSLKNFRVANRIAHVKDGQAALDYLFRKGEYSNPETSPRPAIILLDLRLPKVDGLEVLRLIKEDAELIKIPALVLTTSAAESDVDIAYAHGAVSYLVKPVDARQFAGLMEAFCLYGRDQTGSWPKGQAAGIKD
ncbi:MAG: response regulator [Elusimicrobia bacterium]|nr:response regulator [Elusimicrobiota bacterium]